MKILKRLFLLCLCVALLGGSALANEAADYSVEGYDQLYYKMTLPDGRLIFTGSVGKPGKYMESKARILCLNPDGTVSWDYMDPEKGSCSFGEIALTKDGSLCALFDNSPYQTTEEIKLKFITTEGKPVGKEISQDLSQDYRILNAGLMIRHFASEAEESYTELVDWDGNVLFRWPGYGPIAVNDLIEEEDGLVMIGREPGMLANAAGKIMKVDWQGNTVWETVMPFQMDYNEGSVMCGIRTGDGGYVAILNETGPNAGGPGSKWLTGIVRFSPDGRILWNHTVDASTLDYVYDVIAEYDGKYVIQCEHMDRFASLRYPMRYLWLDADGNELGITEMELSSEDLPKHAGKKNVNMLSGGLFPMNGSLWMISSWWEDNSKLENEMASADDVFLKVPEL